jgi:hypothetical protein
VAEATPLRWISLCKSNQIPVAPINADDLAGDSRTSCTGEQGYEPTKFLRFEDAMLHIRVKGHPLITAPVHTDPIVLEVDALQQQTNEGPCLDAIAHRLIFYADDLSKDLRWLHFAPLATRAGIRSVLALPLSADTDRGALNLYARYPSAFGVVDRAKAALLVSMANLALSVAHSHEDGERRAANLHAGLSSRETIGEALGILIERERITARQAFDILRRASQHLNVKLREVAQNLVDTGEDPDTGRRPSPDRGEGRCDRSGGGSS